MMLKEFKEFEMSGNVLDMAIGIIIGGAFGKIVSSVVSDILMHPQSQSHRLYQQLRPILRPSTR